MEAGQHSSGGNAQKAISQAAVQILREHTGRGPTRARTHIADDLVTIVLGDTLTRGEQKLVDAGHAERVLELRHDFQMMMKDDLVMAVEQNVERKVLAFMSANHTDPDLAVESFVLAPAE